ncbi:hypothetical protein LLH23_19835 [bacterium]|nr:hypothetical protein [bacterium]
MSVGLIILGMVFGMLVFVAATAAVYGRLLRFPWRPHPATVAEARIEGLLLIVLCTALSLLGLLGAGVMAWVGAQVARQHPGSSLVAAPLLIGLACLLVACGCGWAVAQEYRRLRTRPPEDSS